MAVSERILRPADNLNPLQIRNANGRGNFDFNMDRPRIGRATPNKHSGKPETFFRWTRNELSHDCYILLGNEVPERLNCFGAQ